jgi:hypothetical protein
MVWVVTGSSESGDNYGPIIYSNKPSNKELRELCGEWDAGDWEGPGDYGSYVRLKVKQTEIKES